MKNRNIENRLLNTILDKVTKPGRYTGNELNVIIKEPADIDVRFLFAFPEVYEIGMSSQATGILYHRLNQIENVWAERVFAPWPDMEEQMRQNDIPLFSLESFTPAAEFDIIGFTLQYELTYTNLLNMLDLAEVPLYADQREEHTPLVIAGGPCSCNPEPLAPFIDAFLIGDGEEAVREICRVIGAGKKEGLSRNQLLKNLAGIRGVYVPQFYKPVYSGETELQEIKVLLPEAAHPVLTNIVPELKSEYYSEKPLVPLIEVTHDRLAVEVMRGCTEGCRYCNAGMIYRPTRERPEQEIVDYSLKAISNSGFEEISFLSLSISDYSALGQLMTKEREALKGRNVNVSFPSMRLDSFSEEIAEFAKSVRKSGFTFAPEAGSSRLRKVINKNISDEDLIKAVEIALQNGWKTLKFYFMIGLPTETKEDVEAIGEMLERVVGVSKKYGRIRFNVSISPHSPKSHTPFQWEKQDSIEEFQEKISILRQKLAKFRQINLTWRNPEYSQIECVLGRGDRRIAKVIFDAWQNGARFDGWNEYFNFQTWKNSFEKNNFDLSGLISEIPETAVLPWDHIDKGVTKHFLLKERKNAYNEVNIIDCKDGTCFGCGIQRKQKYAEFAECYKDLSLHRPDIENRIEADAPKTQAENSFSGETEKPEIPERIFYRMQFSKTGYSKYISHLDLIRVFDRAFRMANLPVAYSEGFNPRPKFSFSQPLSLGQSSESEFVDVEFFSNISSNLPDILNRYLPAGLKIHSVKPITGKTDSLSSVISVSDYVVELSGAEVSDDQIAELLHQDNITVTRTTKGKLKEIDLKPFIQSIRPDRHRVNIRLASVDGRNAKIKEIMNLLLPAEKQFYSIHRKAQYVEKENQLVSPMEII